MVIKMNEADGIESSAFLLVDREKSWYNVSKAVAGSFGYGQVLPVGHSRRPPAARRHRDHLPLSGELYGMLEAKLSPAALDTDKSSLSAIPAGLLPRGGTGTTCRKVGGFMVQ